MVDTNETTLEISANGQSITAKVLPFFKSLTLTDKKGLESDSMLLYLSDPGKVLGEPESLVKLSFMVNGLNKGTYEVNEISGDIHTGDLEISGTALLTKGEIKIAKSRSFDPLTVEDLVKQIAGEHGYQPVVGAGVARVNLGHINQVKESDLNLLTRLAQDNDAIFKISQDRLVFIGADAGEDAHGEKLPVMKIDDPEITTGRWTSKKREKVGGVRVAWLNEDANRIEYETAGDGPHKEARRQCRSKEEAAALAASEYQKVEKMDRDLSINIPLDVRYAAGCIARISNHGPIDGEWLIESFRHTIDLESYDSTSITLARPD